jgi:hypothetical protein
LERCTFCDAAVPLDSPEIAYCQSVQSKKGKTKHKLQRCSVSLQVSDLIMVSALKFVVDTVLDP